jgi:hypothetical protein
MVRNTGDFPVVVLIVAALAADERYQWLDDPGQQIVWPEGYSL